jgi:hypothetical protein
MTQYKFSVGSTPTTVAGNLGWNANGTLASLGITDQFNSANTQNCTYSYDDLARIVGVNCGSVWSQTFGFDPFGNLTKSGSVSFQPGYTYTNGSGQTVNNNRIQTLPSLNNAIIVLLMALFVAGSPQRAAAQQRQRLTVHVVNAKTGKPFGKTVVYLFLNKDYPRVVPNEPPPLRAATAADGIAVFELDTPHPEEVFFAVPGGDRLCSRFRYSTEQILDKGIVGENACEAHDRLRNRFSAKPGELILFVSPYSRGEIFKREIGR